MSLSILSIFNSFIDPQVMTQSFVFKNNQEHNKTNRERSGSVEECLTRDRGGRGFEPHQRHCAVSLSKNINPTLVLVQPSKTRPFITKRVLMGRKESNQTNK